MLKACTDGHCLTCSDELLLVRVREVNAETNLALVDGDGQIQEIDITLVEGVSPGDVLLVHGGVAITREDGNIQHEH